MARQSQSTDESSGSPGTFSPEIFEEDNPPDPSGLKKVKILKKGNKEIALFFNTCSVTHVKRLALLHS